SLRLWRRRECRILASCLSIYLSDHDYPSAIDTAELMIEQLRPLNEHQPLYALLGRIYLRVRCFVWGPFAGSPSLLSYARR
ncbi:unnamed protein product, partial [Dibothriocephalus latus]